MRRDDSTSTSEREHGLHTNAENTSFFDDDFSRTVSERQLGSLDAGAERAARVGFLEGISHTQPYTAAPTELYNEQPPYYISDSGYIMSPNTLNNYPSLEGPSSELEYITEDVGSPQHYELYRPATPRSYSPNLGDPQQEWFNEQDGAGTTEAHYDPMEMRWDMSPTVDERPWDFQMVPAANYTTSQAHELMEYDSNPSLVGATNNLSGLQLDTANVASTMPAPASPMSLQIVTSSPTTNTTGNNQESPTTPRPRRGRRPRQGPRERPPCDICGPEVTFSRRADLNRHINSCHGNPADRYVCQHCNHPFSRNDNLTAHIRQFHPEHYRRRSEHESEA